MPLIFALVQRQSGILGIVLKQTALFQAASDAVAERVDECVKLTVRRRFDSMEALLSVAIFGINAIEKKHMISMQEQVLFSAALGLQPLWYVLNLDFSLKNKKLDIAIDFERGEEVGEKHAISLAEK